MKKILLRIGVHRFQPWNEYFKLQILLKLSFATMNIFCVSFLLDPLPFKLNGESIFYD